MLRPVFLITALLLPSIGIAQTVFTPSKDGNTIVCADIRTTISNTIEAWILGYWSGMNIGKEWEIGKGTSPNGILGEVQLHCQNNPSQTLQEAVTKVYYKMAAQKR